MQEQEVQGLLNTAFGQPTNCKQARDMPECVLIWLAGSMHAYAPAADHLETIIYAAGALPTRGARPSRPQSSTNEISAVYHPLQQALGERNASGDQQRSCCRRNVNTNLGRSPVAPALFEWRILSWRPSYRGHAHMTRGSLTRLDKVPAQSIGALYLVEVV